jgi:Galactose oxidase, central domain
MEDHITEVHMNMQPHNESAALDVALFLTLVASYVLFAFILVGCGSAAPSALSSTSQPLSIERDVVASSSYANTYAGGFGVGWTEVQPSGGQPTPRQGQSMVFVPLTGQVVMFGGQGSSGLLDDTWSYDPVGRRWAELRPSGPLPTPRKGQSMVFVPLTGEVIMFGGAGVNSLLNDTWSYDPLRNAWHEYTVSGPGGFKSISPPSPRTEQAMVFDLLAGEAILFGGGGAEGVLGDTWAYEPIGHTWTELHPAGPLPAARQGQAMAFDLPTNQILLVGGVGKEGVVGDIWNYDPSGNTWMDLSGGSVQRPFRAAGAAACSSATGRTVLFGGENQFSTISGDTWVGDGGKNWSAVPGSESGPAARRNAAMAYCELSDTYVLFGGADTGNHVLGDTWVYWAPNIRH